MANTRMGCSAEYLALVSSFFLVGLEAVIRILTLALPSTIISLFYRASRRLFNRLVSPAVRKSESKKKNISTPIRDASDFVDLCALYGYYAEEHIVQTGDGYLLGLHRLAWRKGEEDEKVNHGNNSTRKPVVYLHHGLMMNSEIWVCLTDEQRCLPFRLVEKGYDVWFGNNRGNKYSKKSVHHSPTDIKFWDFSMDEFAFHDIPDSIAYILETTSQPSLSYIGFSQGTAQAFAALAVHPRLNDQVNVFIALAPAMAPAGFRNGVVDALVKASPQVLFLLFGRRSILASTTMWQSILYPPIFIRAIDMGLKFLFGWHAQNISASQKLAAYPHLYSFTSTKSVVHWFQIIRTKSFQMFDDDVQPVLSTGSKYTKVAKFPTKNIKTPIVLVYGGADSLVDINVMLKELPPHTIATEIKHYEHVDFLWARDVNTLVFPHVFDALESFSDAEHSKEEYDNYRSARHASLAAGAKIPKTLSMSYASDDDSEGPFSEIAAQAPTSHNSISQSRNGNGPRSKMLEPAFPRLNTSKRAKLLSSGGGKFDGSSDSGPASPNGRGHIRTVTIDEDPTSPKNPTPASVRTGLDGSEDTVNGLQSPSKITSKKRTSSIGSNLSDITSMGGIRIGAGKAANPTVSQGVTKGQVMGNEQQHSGGEGKRKGSRNAS